MTAAVAPHVPVRGTPTDHSRPVSPTPPSGPDAPGSARRRASRTPYLAPVPVSEPPFDDERAAPDQSTTSPAAFDVVPAAGSPADLAGPTTITAAGVPHWSSEADVGVRRTATHHLPPAQRAAWVLARAVVEVLSGRRPVAQLRVHCAPDIYAGLLQRPFAGHQALPHVLSVRVCEPADGVAEVSVAFRRAERVRAMAFRIQGVDGRWRITALQLG